MDFNTWAYDNRNLVPGVSYEGKAIVSQTHDDGYRLTNQTLGNGLTRTIAYGRADNLRTADTTFDGATALGDLDFSYSYAIDKQVTAETIDSDLVPDASFTASYDDGNRVTGWDRPGAPGTIRNTQSWNYDAAGNWNSTTIDGTAENRSHTTADQISLLAGNVVTNDLKGNLTAFTHDKPTLIGPVETDYLLEWDLDNRLKKATVENDDVEYRYDALGRRVIRKEGTDETALIWWGDSENAEYEHSAGQSCIQNDIFAHPSTLNTVIARAVDGDENDLQWYHKNYLDHVYAVSDDGGDILEHYRYSAFGEIEIFNELGTRIAATAIDNQITWNTRRLDELSGFYLYKYRHYSPQLGRWPSRDPIEGKGGYNLYGFVGNDGVNWIDDKGNRRIDGGDLPIIPPSDGGDDEPLELPIFVECRCSGTLTFEIDQFVQNVPPGFFCGDPFELKQSYGYNIDGGFYTNPNLVFDPDPLGGEAFQTLAQANQIALMEFDQELGIVKEQQKIPCCLVRISKSSCTCRTLAFWISIGPA